MAGRGTIPVRVAGAILVLLSLSGCSYGPYGTTAHPIFGGAALGAAVGAIGGAVVGRPGAGAAAGVAAGAFLGGATASARRHYGYSGRYGPPRRHGYRPHGHGHDDPPARPALPWRHP